ncbi:hypothetical protein [Streptomyces sp. SCL15-4]|uniref:hypothetical protein n=1 Tax=Streptomyces sp. SCL15-4 TaxID=2967221 RepID=UPI002966FFD2|nr:hypothetical protein [Streptomyces sp. SCL15-4]
MVRVADSLVVLGEPDDGRLAVWPGKPTAADWLTTGQYAVLRQRAGILATTHARLHTAAGARR